MGGSTTSRWEGKRTQENKKNKKEERRKGAVTGSRGGGLGAVRCTWASEISFENAIADKGIPEASPLAMTWMSGVTS